MKVCINIMAILSQFQFAECRCIDIQHTQHFTDYTYTDTHINIHWCKDFTINSLHSNIEMHVDVIIALLFTFSIKLNPKPIDTKKNLEMAQQTYSVVAAFQLQHSINTGTTIHF